MDASVLGPRPLLLHSLRAWGDLCDIATGLLSALCWLKGFSQVKEETVQPTS